jgi:hypothetical protein
VKPYLKNNQSKKGWWSGSSGRAPVYQVQSLNSTPVLPKKKKKKKVTVVPTLRAGGRGVSESVGTSTFLSAYGSLSSALSFCVLFLM